MRHVFKLLVLSAVLQAVAITPARAAISWWWIDNLSGPGPFVGFESEWRIWCAGGTLTGTEAVGFESECLSGTVKEHKWSVNLNTGIYFALHNNLQYADASSGHNVQLIRVGPSLARAFFERTLELKAGVEWDMFLGNDFPLFSRVGIPLLVDYKPFVRDRTNTGKSLRNMVTIRGGLLIMPKGFDATDFGAKAGTFHTSSEVLPTIGVVFDLGYRR